MRFRKKHRLCPYISFLAYKHLNTLDNKTNFYYITLTRAILRLLLVPIGSRFYFSQSILGQ